MPARLVGEGGRRRGDCWPIEGDPSARIGDLRQTRLVMLDGKLLDANAFTQRGGVFGAAQIDRTIGTVDRETAKAAFLTLTLWSTTALSSVLGAAQRGLDQWIGRLSGQSLPVILLG